MSDVIEVMARALDDGDYPMATYRRDVIDMLEAAEKAGWRLVPVEPTEEMCDRAAFITVACDSVSDSLRSVIEAAPRPWDGVKNDS